MATESVGDLMQVALEARYGTENIGDGYAEWIAEFGPTWAALVAEVETATGEPLNDGWETYWQNGIGGVPATFYILLENGDRLMAENNDLLRRE